MADLVSTAAATSTAYSDTVQNPTGTAVRQIVHVTLIFDGVTFDPAVLYSTLDAGYATVTSQGTTPARGSYRIIISP